MDRQAIRGPFEDRIDAGRRLAAALLHHRGSDAVVLGLARGGVAIGAAVARELRLPLLPLVVRKIGAPSNPELALGAVSETGVQWIDRTLLEPTGATEAYLRGAVAAQVTEARRQQEEYGTGQQTGAIRDRVTIVVDDGIATGATASVAIRSARDLGASSVVLATPVASRQAVQLLERYADRVVVLLTPEPFGAVGLYYRKFDQVDDDEVKRYLRNSAPKSETRSP